jgi:outer membrane protein TolC
MRRITALAVAAAFLSTPRPAAQEVSLGDLYQAALANDGSITQRRLELDAARLDAEDARSARLPTVRTEASASLLSDPIEPVSVTAGQFGTFETAAGSVALPPEDIRVFEGMESTRYELAVVVEQPVYTWGRISAGIEAAESAVEARAIETDIARRDLAARLRTQVLSLAILADIQELLSEQRSLAARLVEISEESFRGGFIIEADVLDARVQAAEIDLADREVSNTMQDIIVDLQVCTGIDGLTLEAVVPDRRPGIDDFPIPNEGAARRSALSQNLELSLVQAGISAREAQEAMATAGGPFQPDVGLQIRFAYSGPRFPLIETDWYGENSRNIVTSVGLSTTLFDAGRTRREEEAAQSDVRLAEANALAARQEIERAVSSDILAMKLATERHTYFELLSESSAEQARLKRARAEAGAAADTEYLVEEIATLGHRISALRELLTYIQAYLRIEATGSTGREIINQ